MSAPFPCCRSAADFKAREREASRKQLPLQDKAMYAVGSLISDNSAARTATFCYALCTARRHLLHPGTHLASPCGATRKTWRRHACACSTPTLRQHSAAEQRQQQEEEGWGPGSGSTLDGGGDEMGER
ncbi:hypothetical protein ABPG75_009196 [Micractinium tetrahymenae]